MKTMNIRKVGLAVLLSSSLGLGLVTGCSKNEIVPVKETVVEQANSFENLWPKLPEYRTKPYAELPLKVGMLYFTEQIAHLKEGTTIRVEYPKKIRSFLRHREVVEEFTPFGTLPPFHEVFQGNGLDSLIYSKGKWECYIKEMYIQPSVVEDVLINRKEKIILPSVRWGIKGIAFFDSFTEAQVNELFKLNDSPLLEYDADISQLHDPNSGGGYLIPNSNYYTVKKMPELDLRLVEIDKEYVVVGIHSR